MERSKVLIALVFIFISANVCKRWMRSFPVTTSAESDRRGLGVTDYFLPQTIEAKEGHSYAPLPPVDPVIARTLDTHDVYSRLVNVDQDLPVQESTQIPYFWHIHKSGGSTMKEVLTCYNRTQTHRRCPPEGELKVCEIPEEKARFVNVDTSYIAGIQRGADLGLFDRHFENLVVDTSRSYEALKMFTPPYRARMFLLLRDPVERAISKFYYLKIAKWERNYKPETVNMTLMEFAHSPFCYNDWITRRLVNKMRGHLTYEDFTTAKEVLRQKALILFTEDMDGASQRLLRYFGWPATDEQRACATKFVQKPVNKNPHPLPSRDSEEWKHIASMNQLDVLLYEYAKEVYAQQTLLLNQMGTQQT